MIAKRSELVLKSFAILKSSVEIQTPHSEDKAEFDPIKETDSCPVDIEYKIEKNTNKEFFRILADVRINCSDDPNEIKPGYSISVSSVAFFEFIEELEKNEKDMLLSISGLSICITNIRQYIINQTSYFPWGPFSFHAVDVNSLILEKKNQDNN